MSEVNLYPESMSSLWIQNLVNGLSGMTIKAKNALYCGASPFQKVEIFDTYSFGRVLCLGGNIVMTEFEDTYHEMIVHPALLMHKSPKKVCCIGGGDGGCLREILKHSSVEQVTVIEIDELVKESIHNYFPTLAEGFGDSRTTVIIDDGYNFLKKCEESFDVIIVDSYDPGGPVQSLETTDFYQIVSMRCNNNGIAVFQTDSPIIRGNYLRMTIQSVSPFFGYYKPYICSIRSFPEGICSFLASAKSEGVLEQFDDIRYNSIANQFSYYNRDIHTGAFLLPEYLKNIVSS